VEDGVGRANRNSRFELFEIISDSCFLLARPQIADRFDFKRKSTARPVCAEHEKNGSAS
jgi:hypothetical protein